MKKTALISALIFCISALFPLYSFSADEEKSKAYILMEAETGFIAEEYNSDVHLNCGCLSKLMTLLLVAEDIDSGKYSLSEMLTASPSVEGTKGAVIWLESGDTLSVEELLKSVIIGNANDAVTVLAEASESSVEEFVMRMNSEAFDLGLRDTVFRSPYGFYDEKEYSTAHDTAVICSELSRYDFLTPYFRTRHDFVKSGQTELVSENPLTEKYERHIGFKACHSEQSGYCIAEGGKSENGTVFVSVVLGADDTDSSVSTAKELLKKGFTEFRVTSTMFPDEMLHPLKVRDGITTAAEIEISKQNKLIVPRGAGELNTVIVLPEYISAPLKKGQRVGTVAFYNGDSQVCESDIIVKDNIERISYWYTFRKMMFNMLK